MRLVLLTLWLLGDTLVQKYHMGFIFWQWNSSNNNAGYLILLQWLTEYSLFQQGGNVDRADDNEAAPDEGQALPELQQANPSFMSTAWVFFKTFFASLLPEGPRVTRNWHQSACLKCRWALVSLSEMDKNSGTSANVWHFSGLHWWIKLLQEALSCGTETRWFFSFQRTFCSI